MLTEQNVIMELTDSSDTMPIGFITSDDGYTLLAVGKTIEIIYYDIIIYKGSKVVYITLQLYTSMYIILQTMYIFVLFFLYILIKDLSTHLKFHV